MLQRHSSFLRILILIGLLTPASSFAEALKNTIDIAPKTIAIQHRNYRLTDEISLFANYMPLDSFTTYFNTGGSLTHFFSDYFAWEVANANFANSSSTGLKDYIRVNYQLDTADEYDILNYFITSNIVYTPLYTKNLVFGSNIGYGDVSFVAGGGISKFNRNGNVNTFDAGIIIRYILGTHWSVKFDARYYFFLGGGLKSNLAIGTGISYNFGGSDEKKSEGDED